MHTARPAASPLKEPFVLAVAVFVLFVSAGILLRIHLIEPDTVGAACMVATPPWWCAPRLWLILSMIYGWGGMAAAALVTASVFTRGKLAVFLLLSGTALAALAMNIFCAGWGSLAAVIALLRAITLQRLRTDGLMVY